MTCIHRRLNQFYSLFSWVYVCVCERLKAKRVNQIPNLATSWITILSPATAQRTSNARSSYRTSQFNFDWKWNIKREKNEINEENKIHERKEKIESVGESTSMLFTRAHTMGERKFTRCWHFIIYASIVHKVSILHASMRIILWLFHDPKGANKKKKKNRLGPKP